MKSFFRILALLLTLLLLFSTILVSCGEIEELKQEDPTDKSQDTDDPTNQPSNNDPKKEPEEEEWEAADSTNSGRSVNYWKEGYGPYPKCQRMINGMKPVEDPNGKIVIDGVHYKMQRFCVETRVFDTPKHYLWPILESELVKDANLVQNPGW